MTFKVPSLLLSIAPESYCDEQSHSNTDMADFHKQLEQMQSFVRSIPYSGDYRQLDRTCNQLTPQQRQEFLRLGNTLLVSTDF